MEYLVKLSDELDDLFGPLVSMATLADIAYGSVGVGALAAGLASGSLIVAVAVLASGSSLIALCQAGRAKLLRGRVSAVPASQTAR